MTTEQQTALRAALDWIDAIPADIVASLPTMPGFDRDWADTVASGRVVQQTAVTLLPCPFCGGQGSMMRQHLPNGWWSSVECDTKGCNVEGPHHQSDAEAIAAWNHRLASQADQGAVARLREALQEIVDDTGGSTDPDAVAAYTTALDALATHPQPSQKGEGDE